MSNAIVEALEDAAKKVGQAVEDAAKSVGKFFDDTASRLKTSAKNLVEHDASSAQELEKAAKDVGSPTVHGAGGDLTKAASATETAGAGAGAEASRIEQYGRQVEEGATKHMTDPLTSGQFPPGYDPLHGQTIEQYVAQHSDGTFTKYGHPNWRWTEETTQTGAVGDIETATHLHEGILDRYGEDHGKFLSPDGTGYPERALPAENLTQSYHRYRVLRPLPVNEGTVGPAFGEPGGGTQYRLNHPVSHYLTADPPYLEEIF